MTEEILIWFAKWTKIKYKLHIGSNDPLYFGKREIWWASLGANIGFEQNGKNEKFERPIIILKVFNEHLLWALPLTSQKKEGKYYYKFIYGNKSSVVIISQFRAISSKRLLRKIGMAPKSDFKEIKKRVKELL